MDWLIWVLISILVCAFSSGMEMAFVSANQLKVELDKKQGVWSAKIISYFTERPRQFLSAMLVGNNVGLVVYGWILGEKISQWFLTHLPQFAHSMGTGGILVTQTLISTVIILIFGEFIPKMMVSSHPNRWLNILAVPLLIWYWVLWPFASVVTWLAQFFIRGNQGSADDKRVFGRVDLDDYLEKITGQPDSKLKMDHEIEIFQNALDFSKTKARDCMVPRNEISALPWDVSLVEIQRAFIETRLSKILIYRETIDNIIGYVHSFDMFNTPKSLPSIVKPVSYVPEAMPGHEMLSKMMREKRNVLVITDEYGGTAGMVTLEDVIEEIIGEIEDEHDVEVHSSTQVSDVEWYVSGRDEIKELNDRYRMQLPEDEDEYDTVGGLILSKTGSFPESGQEIVVGQYRIVILEVTDRTIEKVHVFLEI